MFQTEIAERRFEKVLDRIQARRADKDILPILDTTWLAGVCALDRNTLPFGEDLDRIRTIDVPDLSPEMPALAGR